MRVQGKPTEKLKFDNCHVISEGPGDPYLDKRRDLRVT